MASSSRILPLVVASALFMENMDSTVIATSLPAMAKDLGTDPVALKLAFTTYLLSLTVFLPISAWVSDKFGAKHVFRWAIAVFTLSSLACAAAPNLFWLVAARGVQGLGGAMMVPVGRIILLRAIPKAELVNALAWLTVPALVGPLVGPPIGGFITTYFTWHWIFWMNLPIGLLGLFMATVYLPEGERAQVPPLDVKGFILSGVGLSCTVFGLTVIGRDLLSVPQTIALIAVGLVSVGLCAPCPCGEKSDFGFAVAFGANLACFGSGWLLLPCCGWCYSIPLAAVAANLLSRHAVAIWLDHLCFSFRCFAHEILGSGDAETFRLSSAFDCERHSFLRLHGCYGCIHGHHAAFGDVFHFINGWLCAVIAIYLTQHNCLFRHSQCSDCAGQWAIYRGATAFAGIGRGFGGSGARGVTMAARCG